MIYSTKHMTDRKRCHYTQRNNAYEALLERYETCGPTSFMSGLNSVGYRTTLIPKVQEEDIVTSFFNNEHNFKDFQRIRQLDYYEVPPNRVPQLYPYMADQLFKARVSFFMGNVKSRTLKELKDFCAVHLCFDDPGHYVVAVGYDEGKNEVVYNDPLEGFNLRFHINRFDAFRNWGNIIYPS